MASFEQRRIVSTFPGGGASRLVIGSDPDPTTGRSAVRESFFGNISQLHMWSRVLSTSELHDAVNNFWNETEQTN